MDGHTLRTAVTAGLIVLGTTACVTRASTVKGDVTAIDVPLSEPQMRVYSACGPETVSIRLIEERRCLRWEYQEIHVGVPQASRRTAEGLHMVAGGASAAAADEWPYYELTNAPPQRRRNLERAVSELVCQVPASGLAVSIDDVEVITNDAGEATVARSTGQIAVSLGEERWYVTCGP